MNAAGPVVRATGGITGWVTGIMETMGSPGAGLVVALENLFPPIPSEVVLPLAGFTASRGGISLAGAIIWTTLGSVAGALVLYYVGALLGRDRTRAIAARMPLVKVSDVDRAEAWFDRHGAKAVFFGRMVPIFRSLISIPAGIQRMRMTTFLTFTALGSLIWNTALITAGYLLGESWAVVQSYTGALQWVVVAAMVLAVGYFVVSRTAQVRRSRRRADEEEDRDR
ncbi:membrane protein DedA with SNARE-associated domain [Spinactinospora alkalitolerans]|uniref:Membrane protein DedA with SNARE-associated domain n=1 Tax=Spinactinospora alkalitolerans TaxID=687207 RepID=A0A852TZV4_9ACTN|nr:DedA family protein [Spinactinospora alkalitolerans]NYE47310.1 membrane protein DedA with SNARE-associated domain [Spinactinospora alkalitolerans]